MIYIILLLLFYIILYSLLPVQRRPLLVPVLGSTAITSITTTPFVWCCVHFAVACARKTRIQIRLPALDWQTGAAFSRPNQDLWVTTAAARRVFHGRVSLSPRPRRHRPLTLRPTRMFNFGSFDVSDYMLHGRTGCTKAPMYYFSMPQSQPSTYPYTRYNI